MYILVAYQTNSMWKYLFTECPIWTFRRNDFPNYSLFQKMFQVELTLFRGGYLLIITDF